MKELNFRTVALMALVAAWFIQIGGQLFALVAVDGTLASAPPRSFAMLQGAYKYDSDAFWATVPPIALALLIIALIANWKTGRRNLLLLTFALSLVTTVVSILYLDPLFNELNAVAYRDEVDPALQLIAAKWHKVEWGVWGASLAGGVALLLALARPGVARDAVARG